MARRVQEEGNRGSNNPLANKREDAHRRAEQKAQAWQTESEKAIMIKTIAAQSKKKITKIKGNDGKVRQVVQIEMNLVSDNLSKKRGSLQRPRGRILTNFPDRTTAYLCRDGTRIPFQSGGHELGSRLRTDAIGSHLRRVGCL